MLGKIILEEAYNLPRLAGAAAFYASTDAAGQLVNNIVDIKGRLAEMDEYVRLIECLKYA